MAIFLELRAAPPEAPLIVTLWPWIHVGDLQIDLALQVDQLSAVMLLVVTGVGSLIHIYSVGYMGDDPGYARYFAYLNLFVAFMLILVLGANLPVLFIGWEGVGLCSYLLIGFWFTDKANADAGKKAFLANRVGDFGFLIAMFLLWQTMGALDFATVLSRAPGTLSAAAATWITLFLLLGCTGKSARNAAHHHSQLITTRSSYSRRLTRVKRALIVENKSKQHKRKRLEKKTKKDTL